MIQESKENYWIGFLIVIAVSVCAGIVLVQDSSTAICIVPLIPVGGGLAVFLARRALREPDKTLTNNRALIEQEMRWLFGDNWRTYTSESHEDIARQRIAARRAKQWQFVIVPLPLYTCTVGLLLFLVAIILQEGEGTILLAIVGIVITGLAIRLLILTARVFPRKATLLKSERFYGESVLPDPAKLADSIAWITQQYQQDLQILAKRS